MEPASVPGPSMLARSPAMLALLLIPTMTTAVTVEPWRFAVETGGRRRRRCC